MTRSWTLPAAERRLVWLRRGIGQSAARLPLSRVPAASGVASATIAAAVAAAWLLGLDAPALLAMRIDAAVAFGCLAAALVLARPDAAALRRLAISVLAAAAVTIALATLTRYVLATETLRTGPVGMSPLTAAAVLALAGALLATLYRARTSVVVSGAAASGVIGTLGLLTSMFGASPPAFLSGTTAMAPHSAAVAILLAVGVVSLLPAGGPLGLFTARGEASRLSRRMLLAAIVVPIGLAWLRLLGQEAGWYDTAYGVSLSVIATIVLLAAVIWRAGLSAQRAEIERQAAQMERDRFFELSLDMLAVAAADGRFIRINAAWQAALGYTGDELTGRPFIEFVHPDDREATVYETRRLFDQGKTVVSFQNRYRHRDGSYRWLEWTAQPSPDRSVVYAVARDITTRKLEEERLVKRAASLALRNERLSDRAVRDPLTALHNRRYFDEALPRLVSRTRRRRPQPTPLSAILFDLDHFGQLNKRYGHQAGDVVLRRFADLLRRRFRGGDLVARYGGEEFVVVLDGATRDDAVRAAEAVREQLVAEPVPFDGQALHASVSAGCAQLSDGMPPAEFLASADVALSLAKRAGRNMVVAA